MTWTVRGGGAGNYDGLVAFRDDMPRDQRLVAAWPKDATADEIADKLERLAADIRAVS